MMLVDYAIKGSLIGLSEKEKCATSVLCNFVGRWNDAFLLSVNYGSSRRRNLDKSRASYLDSA